MPLFEKTKKIKKRILCYYVRGSLYACILVIIASGMACGINQLHFLNEISIKITQLASIIPGAAAIYGKRAIPEIWTTGADSTEEKYNDNLFNWLSSIGFFLAVWAFQLK